jgi:hypothetical protein
LGEGIEREIEDVVIQGASHEARRTILKIIDSAENGASYSELLHELRLSTGRLNYHLGQLEGLIERNSERRYILTPLGKRAVVLLGSITQDLKAGYERYLKAARHAQTSTLHPLVKLPIYIGIAGASIALCVWGFLLYTLIQVGGPSFVYILLPLLLVIGFAVLAWLIYALKAAPEFLRRLEKRLA